MKTQKRPVSAPRFRPQLELLEARRVPAFNAFQDVNGDVYLTEDNVTTADLNVTQTANNAISYVYGASNGAFAGVANLYMTLGAATANHNMTLDLGGFTLSGSVFLATGNSTAQYSLYVGLPGNPNLTSGTIAGDLNVNTGNGADFFGLAVHVAVAGNVYVATGAGNDTVSLFNFVGGTQGNVAVYGGNFVNVQSTIDGSLTVGSTNPAANPFNPLTIKTSAVTSITLTNPAATDITSSFIDLFPNTLVKGDLNVATSQAFDLVTMESGVHVLGNAALNLGNGNNEVFVTPTAAVFGNLNILAGNGNDLVDFAGTVLGDLAVNLGGSSAGGPGNVMDFNAGCAVLGNGVRYTGGNGANTVNVGGLTAPGANFQILLGAGNDFVSLDAGNTLVARAFFDGGFGLNQFVVSDGAIHFPFARRHFV